MTHDRTECDRARATPEEPAFPPLTVVDLAVEGKACTDPYRNIVVSSVNDHCLRLSSFEGVYPWHAHPNSDEMFIVVEGELEIDLDDGRTLRLAPWQAVTLPAGVVHRTRAIGRVVNVTIERLTAATTFMDGATEPR